MKCYCCDREVALVRHVKLRGDVMSTSQEFSGPDDLAYLSYKENATYRAALVCPGCYRTLDSFDGTGEILGRVYPIAGASRRGRAATYNQAKYDKFIEKKDRELGLG